jgi:hypothetical protein
MPMGGMSSGEMGDGFGGGGGSPLSALSSMGGPATMLAGRFSPRTSDPASGLFAAAGMAGTPLGVSARRLAARWRLTHFDMELCYGSFFTTDRDR